MLSEALRLVVDDLATQVQVADASIHPGIFDAAELARTIVAAPALRLACAGLVPGDYGGGDHFEYLAALVLYLPVRDVPGRARAATVTDDLVWPLLGYLPGRQYPAPWSGPATTPTAANLYSAKIDSTGVAMWSIEWDMPIRLPRRRGA